MPTYLWPGRVRNMVSRCLLVARRYMLGCSSRFSTVDCCRFGWCVDLCRLTLVCPGCHFFGPKFGFRCDCSSNINRVPNACVPSPLARQGLYDSERFRGNFPESSNIGRVIHDMHSSMAVRAQCYGIMNGVLPTIRQPFNMVNFPERTTMLVEERSLITTQLTMSLCPASSEFSYIWISFVCRGERLTPSCHRRDELGTQSQ